MLVRLFAEVMLRSSLLTSLDVDQSGEDRAVDVSGLTSHQAVVEVTPPPLRRERKELERSIGEAGDQTRVGGERSSLLTEPGDGRVGLPRDSAVQDPAGLVGECEGGGERQVEVRSIALSMQDRSCN